MSRLRLFAALLLAWSIGLASAPASASDADASEGRSGLDQALALRASQAAVGRELGEHLFRDRAGRTVALSSYRGKPLLVSFIYTGCFQICPGTTRALQQAVEALQKSVGPGQFNVVSIGFNQPEDSPGALKAFAAQFQIHSDNWEFLSPRAADVPALTQDFGFLYAPTAAGFDHVLQLSLVDSQGRIVRQIYGEQLNAADLGEPLRLLLAGSPVQPERLLEGLFERVRLVCTVYDPKTGDYRVDYTLPIQIAGGVTFFVVMMVFFFREWRATRPQARPRARVR
ncbi:MAG: SCO family protein [Burkholderiaceae bacterium]|jgi:protein SCO1/2|nr:SCO family protein [Burkholderiaceae bacterium]MCO5105305.1 SCO family protein [Burkholderiaceae bacterium]